MTPKRCILISTYDRYRSIASFTRKLIERNWPSHPEMFVCGCTRPADDHELPLRDDPRDWIGIMQSAAEDLIAKGFERAYYIMDDCPPFGRCSERHLNETIPGLMEALGASYIGLVGWDQRRGNAGSMLGRGFYSLQRQAPDFTWQFSTDPCYWNLHALRDLCRAMVPTDDPQSRTAWAFERRIGRTPDIVPEAWRGTSYRICGYAMLPWWRSVPRRAGYRLLDVARWLTARGGGAGALAKLDEAVQPETYFYDGPYPTYWEGVMGKGQFNANVRRFLRRHLRWSYLKELEEHVGRVPPAVGA